MQAWYVVKLDNIFKTSFSYASLLLIPCIVSLVITAHMFIAFQHMAQIRTECNTMVYLVYTMNE